MHNGAPSPNSLKLSSHHHHKSKSHSKLWHQLLANRRQLPVWEHKGTFFKLLQANKTIVIAGETGSGKTTQIPQWCMEFCQHHYRDKNLAVACTQPRRVAAMSVAARVAYEADVKLGHEVGYSVRFESNSSDKTKLKYLTDGMLLREAMLDNLLKRYGIIILDEAHERTLSTEILFGVLKRALELRNNDNAYPLKIIVMSATIDVDLFKNFFNSSSVLTIPGRQYPVEEFFAETHQADLLTSTLTVVFQIHRKTEDGDILVFCSGQDEIRSLVIMCKRVLKEAPDELKNLEPLPLYAHLPVSHQMRVFEKNPRPPTTNNLNGHQNGTSNHEVSQRRVIFSTNVAETSITIPNIKYVIDTGKVKSRYHCPKTGFDYLKVTNVSKAQARQRSGRAGRVCEGQAYRLYTDQEFERMKEHQTPEIRRCNLDSVLLQLISIGVNDISSFDFLEKPSTNRCDAALRNLIDLKAIVPSMETDGDKRNGYHNSAPHQSSSNGERPEQKVSILLNQSYRLTDLGKKLTHFPLSPAMGRVLLAADSLGCLDEALTIISLLCIEDLFFIPPNKQSRAESMLEKFRTDEGDTIMMLKAYRALRRISMLDKSNLKQWCLEHFINVKNYRLARLIRKQLLDICKVMKMEPSTCGGDFRVVRKAIVEGFPNNVATLINGKYRNQVSNDLQIHPSSCLFKCRPEKVIYTEVIETNKLYLKNLTLHPGKI